MSRMINSVLLILLSAMALTSCAGNEPYHEERDSDNSDKALRVLAIGNSFTVDATEYLPDLLATIETDKDIMIARLVKGGTSLRQHWENHLSGAPEYRFDIVKQWGWSTNDNIRTIDDALSYADWDVIVIQQVSGLSGIIETYHPYIENLIGLIREQEGSPSIAFMITWAYSTTSTHPDFARYGNDRTRMYRAIIEAVSSIRENVDIIVPAGELIEQLRNTELNNSLDLTVDGYHLDPGLPRYACACLWHEMLIRPVTRQSVLGSSFRPQVGAVRVTDHAMVRTRKIIENLVDAFSYKFIINP